MAALSESGAFNCGTGFVQPPASGIPAHDDSHPNNRGSEGRLRKDYMAFLSQSGLLIWQRKRHNSALVGVLSTWVILALALAFWAVAPGLALSAPQPAVPEYRIKAAYLY